MGFGRNHKINGLLLSSLLGLAAARPVSAASCSEPISERQFADLMDRFAPTGRAGQEAAAYLAVASASGEQNEIFSQSADRFQAIASTQKMLTAWVTYKYGISSRKIKLSTQVPFKKSYIFFDAQGGRSRDDQDVIVSSEKIEAAEALGRQYRVSVQRLLYNLLIISANGSAQALADATSGNPEAFVKLMNEEARSILGASTRSYFQNPHGLTDTDDRYRHAAEPNRRQQSSARELALLMSHFMADRGFRSFLKDVGAVTVAANRFHKFGITQAAGSTVVASFPLGFLCGSRRLVLSIFGRTYQSNETPRNQIDDFRLLMDEVAKIIK